MSLQIESGSGGKIYEETRIKKRRGSAAAFSLLKNYGLFTGLAAWLALTAIRGAVAVD